MSAKLSNGQIKTLASMSAGNHVHWASGYRAHAFWAKNYVGLRNPQINTMLALEKAGAIHRTHEDWRGWQWHITDAGRSMLSTDAAEKERG